MEHSVRRTSHVINLLEADPDLTAGMPPEEVEAARPHAMVRAVHLERGSWEPELPNGESRSPAVGLLVLDGLLSRDVGLGPRSTTELLGTGDLLRPWDQDANVGPLPLHARWTVLEPTVLAVLDRRFAAIAGRWPALFDAITSRAMRRSRQLVAQLVVNQVIRIDHRLLFVLWSLAERWGRVTPDGVVLTIPLTHATLARLVGARRPSVTTALGQLARDELVVRTEQGFLLQGSPDDVMGHVERMAAGDRI